MAGQIGHLILKQFIVPHILGTVIGDNFGLARKATAIAVRVLNDNGSGSFAYVVQLTIVLFINIYTCIYKYF